MYVICMISKVWKKRRNFKINRKGGILKKNPELLNVPLIDYLHWERGGVNSPWAVVSVDANSIGARGRHQGIF